MRFDSGWYTVVVGMAWHGMGIGVCLLLFHLQCVHGVPGLHILPNCRINTDYFV